MTGFIISSFRSRWSPALRHKLMEQAGFTFVKSFCVERIGQVVKLIVQMMAELMQKGSQKGFERDHAAVLGRAHPERDQGSGASFSRLVQSMQFSPRCGRTYCEHFDTKWRNGKAARDAQGKPSASIFHLFPVSF